VDKNLIVRTIVNIEKIEITNVENLNLEERRCGGVG
jgi:hypothetical protein